MGDSYYDTIASVYDELHEEEQAKKLEIIKQYLSITPETKLLDVGCGSGVGCQFACDVTGVDPSEELLEIAEKKFPHAQFFQAPAEELPFDDHSFDIVISLTAIQNFDSIEQGLQEIRRVGTTTFALSYLRRSEKAEQIAEKIKEVFAAFKIKEIEEEKDAIFIINK